MAGARQKIHLMDLPQGVLSCILSALPSEQLINVSMVCKAFASTADKLLEDLCKSKGWAQPRFPRGQSAIAMFPWRSLYRSGEFPLRQLVGAYTKHLICKRCTCISWVRERLVKENLFVDLEGVTGKRLLSKGPFSRRRMPSMT